MNVIANDRFIYNTRNSRFKMIVPVACKPCQVLAWNLTAGVGLERMEVWTGRGNTIGGGGQLIPCLHDTKITDPCPR